MNEALHLCLISTSAFLDYIFLYWSIEVCGNLKAELLEFTKSSRQSRQISLRIWLLIHSSATRYYYNKINSCKSNSQSESC